MESKIKCKMCGIEFEAENTSDIYVQTCEFCMVNIIKGGKDN